MGGSIGVSGKRDASIASGDPERVLALLRAGDDPNLPDEGGVSFLARAAATGSVEVVRALIEAGAAVDAESSAPPGLSEGGKRLVPLMAAAVGGNRRVYDYLFPLTDEAIRKDVRKRFKALKKKRDRKLEDDPRVKALIKAADSGDEGEVARQIAAGVDLRGGDTWGVTALSLASLRGHDSIVRILLDAGAYPDGEPETGLGPIGVAASPTIAEALLRAGADPSRIDEGSTALNTAAVWNRADIAAILIRAGAPIDARTEPHGCALSTAISLEKFEVARFLIASGADVNFRVKKDWPPLMYAASVGDESIVRALLDAGADARYRDGDGDTPLSVAAARGHLRIADMLAVAREAGSGGKG